MLVGRADRGSAGPRALLALSSFLLLLLLLLVVIVVILFLLLSSCVAAAGHRCAQPVCKPELCHQRLCLCVPALLAEESSEEPLCFKCRVFLFLFLFFFFFFFFVFLFSLLFLATTTTTTTATPTSLPHRGPQKTLSLTQLLRRSRLAPRAAPELEQRLSSRVAVHSYRARRPVQCLLEETLCLLRRPPLDEPPEQDLGDAKELVALSPGVGHAVWDRAEGGEDFLQDCLDLISLGPFELDQLDRRVEELSRCDQVAGPLKRRHRVEEVEIKY